MPYRLIKVEVRKVGLPSRGALQENYVDTNKHYRNIGLGGVLKYLGESYYHHIECSAANFLVALIWRRPLNSAALAIPTHRGPERVSDGTNT